MNGNGRLETTNRVVFGDIMNFNDEDSPISSDNPSNPSASPFVSTGRSSVCLCSCESSVEDDGSSHRLNANRS